MTTDLDTRIKERAYEIWESEGRPEGREHEHWRQARAEFAEAQSEVAARKAPARASKSGVKAPTEPTRKKPRAAAKPRASSSSRTVRN